MVGNTLQKQNQKSEFYVDDIPIEDININTNKIGEKSVVTEEIKISLDIKFKEEMREKSIIGNTSEIGEDNSSQPSTSKFCSINKDKNSLRKFKRSNRCKYCRRLVGSPTTLLYTKSGKSLMQSRCNIRRPLEHTMDEVAWACGRIWCSVSRRKRRKIADNRTRKQINEAFSTLREILPPAEQPEHEDSAAAKVSTLRLAASYIQALSDLLRETHLSDKSPRPDLKGNDVECEKTHLKCEDKLVSSAGKCRQKSSDDYPSSKGGVGPPSKFHKNCFKPDKQRPIVKNIPGNDSPLECV
ncbi:UNVERIFIED_CONTAM: hypothetical protein RMT77_002116 [Armadillidium vulgare]